jgi:hypothetical protein
VEDKKEQIRPPTFEQPVGGKPRDEAARPQERQDPRVRQRFNQLNRGGTSDASAAIDAYAELAEAGVTWAGFHVPAPNPKQYADNLQWFGEEVIAKVR